MRRLMIALVGLSALAAPSIASAGVYGDDLSKCMVKAMTADDQTAFMMWMISALGQHPAAKPYFTMTDAQRDAVTKRASELLQRLILVDCRPAATDAIKYEGPDSLAPAFSLVGGAAVRGLMGDPGVAKAINHLGDFADKSKFEQLAREAGIPETDPAK